MNDTLKNLYEFLGVQWSHSDLRLCSRGWSADWAVPSKKGWAQLSKDDELEGRHWTVTVVAAD